MYTLELRIRARSAGARIAALLIGTCVGLAAPRAAYASQLQTEGACHIVVHVPSLLGGQDLDYRIADGTVLSEGNDGKFCGATTLGTPFGDSTSDKCFHMSDGTPDSAAFGNKVTSSTCKFLDAGTFRTPYRAADFGAWNGKGDASVHGQAFLRTVGGDVKTCAGESVLLLPDNAYIDEYLGKVHAGITEAGDAQAMASVRSTICDAQGGFSFDAVPAQRWYVLTKVTWGVPNIETGGTDLQGGEMLQAVALHAGANQVFLTDRDRR